MIKHVLVTSDLSARSDRALDRAVLLAREIGAALSVLHVLDDEQPPEIVAQARMTAQTLLEKALAVRGVGQAKVIVTMGQPVETIIQTTRALRADLLLMGVHRARPFWDMIAGTTMERTVRAIDIPVLLVTNRADAPYASALVGLDFSPAAAAAAQVAAAIAPQARLTAFHAAPLSYRGFLGSEVSAHSLEPYAEAATAELTRWWETAQLPAALECPKPMMMDLQAAFEHAFAATCADLVVIGAHGRPMLAPTRLGSFAERLLRAPCSDILVVRR